MKKKDFIQGILLGLVLGVILGAIIYKEGLGSVCPINGCIDSSMIRPVTDRGYTDQALAIIRSAKKTIHVAAFELKYYENHPDSSSNLIVRELIYAKERGVDVKIIVDEFSKENNAMNILFYNDIPVVLDGDSKTMHAKFIVVDGKIILIGSTNFSYYGLEKNDEANVLIEDEDIAKFYIGYFNRL